MLTYLLAFAVAIASIGFYAITLFLPAFRREQDLIWSGVGLFYALVLWVCAGQVRGGLLLGQIASVALIGWLGWQAFGSRWQSLSETDKAQAKVITDIKEKFDQVDFSQLSEQAKGLANKAKNSAQSLGDKAKNAAGSAQELASKTKDVAANATSKATAVASEVQGVAINAIDPTDDTTTSSTPATDAASIVDEVPDQEIETSTEPELKRPNMSAAEAREEISEMAAAPPEEWAVEVGESMDEEFMDDEFMDEEFMDDAVVETIAESASESMTDIEDKNSEDANSEPRNS